MPKWNEKFEPRAGGWSRLAAKLNTAENERRQEIRVWGAVAMFLILVTAFSALRGIGYRDDNRFQIKTPSAGEVLVESAYVMKVSGTPAGINYFWIIR